MCSYQDIDGENQGHGDLDGDGHHHVHVYRLCRRRHADHQHPDHLPDRRRGGSDYYLVRLVRLCPTIYSHVPAPTLPRPPCPGSQPLSQPPLQRRPPCKRAQSLRSTETNQRSRPRAVRVVRKQIRDLEARADYVIPQGTPCQCSNPQLGPPLPTHTSISTNASLQKSRTTPPPSSRPPATAT